MLGWQIDEADTTLLSVDDAAASLTGYQLLQFLADTWPRLPSPYQDEPLRELRDPGYAVPKPTAPRAVSLADRLAGSIGGFIRYTAVDTPRGASRDRRRSQSMSTRSGRPP